MKTDSEREGAILETIKILAEIAAIEAIERRREMERRRKLSVVARIKETLKRLLRRGNK